MGRKYFGTDGIRGRVGTFPITPDFALKLGWAAGKVLATHGSTKVLIGKDTRISSYMLEAALEAGFAAAGINVAFIGPMPTPACAYLTRTFRAEAGVVISASHNPFYDNGIKFFSNLGSKLSDEVEKTIETMLDHEIECVESEFLGKASRINDAAGRYIEFCKSTFPSNLSLSGYKLVVDCANGATYHIAPSVFRELGAEVISINDTPNGTNINLNCGATDIEMLRKTVLDHKADVGLAFDGDGDRLIMIDSLGNKVDGDQILYVIAAKRLADNNFKGGVVGTKMTNMGLEVALKKLNIPLERADVGDRYVFEKMQELGWCLGGENSGHIILLDKNTTGDGIIAGLEVLKVMLETGENLHTLCGKAPLYPQVLLNEFCPLDRNPFASEKVKQVEQQAIDELSGLGRVLLRKSGTEPLVRVMVEAEDGELAMCLAQKILAAVKDEI